MYFLCIFYYLILAKTIGKIGEKIQSIYLISHISRKSLDIINRARLFIQEKFAQVGVYYLWKKRPKYGRNLYEKIVLICKNFKNVNTLNYIS